MLDVLVLDFVGGGIFIILLFQWCKFNIFLNIYYFFYYMWIF